MKLINFLPVGKVMGQSKSCCAPLPYVGVNTIEHPTVDSGILVILSDETGLVQMYVVLGCIASVTAVSVMVTSVGKASPDGKFFCCILPSLPSNGIPPEVSSASSNDTPPRILTFASLVFLLLYP